MGKGLRKEQPKSAAFVMQMPIKTMQPKTFTQSPVRDAKSSAKRHQMTESCKITFIIESTTVGRKLSTYFRSHHNGPITFRRRFPPSDPKSPITHTRSPNNPAND